MLSTRWPASFCAGKRTMPVRELHAGADPDELARGITAAHPALLGPQAVSHQQAHASSIQHGPCGLLCGPALTAEPACFAAGSRRTHAESCLHIIRCCG